MSTTRSTLCLTHADDTTRRAVQLGKALEPGDTILLSGGVGAGKTHFARSMIQSLLKASEDVPSPTFTLVQSYDTTKGPLWHADLYRLTSSMEVEELGLTEAFEDAICIVEWPDRLGRLQPETALHIELAVGADDDSRGLTATWSAEAWAEKLKVWQS